MEGGKKEGGWEGKRGGRGKEGNEESTGVRAEVLVTLRTFTMAVKAAAQPFSMSCTRSCVQLLMRLGKGRGEERTGGGREGGRERGREGGRERGREGGEVDKMEGRRGCGVQVVTCEILPALGRSPPSPLEQCQSSPSA